MRDLKKGLWLIALGIWFLVGATYVHAEEVYPEKEWVWGCQIRGRMLSGECVVRKFTKVGETENDIDTDEPRTLGFEPGNIPLNSKGDPIWSRIPADLFLRPGETKMRNAARCTCGR